MSVHKRCSCAKSSWRQCPHPYYLYVKYKGSTERRVLGAIPLKKAKEIETAVKAEFHRSFENGSLQRAFTRVGSERLTIESLIERDKKAAVARGGRDGHQISPGYLKGGLENAYKSIREYVEHIRVTEGQELLPRDFTTDRILDYVAWRRQQVGANTARREVTILKRMVADAADVGQAMPLIKPPRVGRGQPKEEMRGRVVPSDVLESFLSHLPQDPQDLYRLARLTGWRDGHLKRLEPHFFEIKPDGSVFADLPGRVLKSRNEYYLPVPPKAWEILQRRMQRTGKRTLCIQCQKPYRRRPKHPCSCGGYRYERRDGQPLPIFETVSFVYWTKRALRQMEADRAAKGLAPYGDTITLRDMRTSYENELMERGLDPTTVMTLMTHNDLKTTAIYSRPRLELLARAALQVGTQNQDTSEASEENNSNYSGLGNRLMAGQRTLTGSEIPDSKTIAAKSNSGTFVSLRGDSFALGHKPAPIDAVQQALALGFLLGVSAFLNIPTTP